MLVLISTTLLSIVVVIMYICYKRWIRGKERDALLLAQTASDAGRLRFRKRDKMLFYGRRMLRKVKNVSGQVYGGQGRKRKAVMRFAKRILQLRKDNIPMQMKTVEPPAEYLEETMEGIDRVPPDALYMLQSIRIFGHFEKPIFLKLCKNTEVLHLEPHDYLFRITDADDSVFIVQSGLVHVFISNADGSTLSLKTVKKGESVTSLLSFIDVLSGNPSFYKTVTAKAVEKSQIIRLPMQAFKEVFDENPDIMIRVIQVIMIRLQRVTFTALRNYLGLNSELVQNVMRAKRPQCLNLKSSPHHRRSESFQHTLSDCIQPPDMIADLADQQHLNVIGPSSGGSGTGANRRYSITSTEVIDSKLIHASAVENFLKELGLTENDRPFLEPNVLVREVDPGDALIMEGNSDVSI